VSLLRPDDLTATGLTRVQKGLAGPRPPPGGSGKGRDGGLRHLHAPSVVEQPTPVLLRLDSDGAKTGDELRLRWCAILGLK
jgi:hypothetical protein